MARNHNVNLVDLDAQLIHIAHVTLYFLDAVFVVVVVLIDIRVTFLFYFHVKCHFLCNLYKCAFTNQFNDTTFFLCSLFPSRIEFDASKLCELCVLRNR